MASGTVAESRFSAYADAFELRNLRWILNLGTLQNGELRRESGVTMPEIVYGTSLSLKMNDYFFAFQAHMARRYRFKPGTWGCTSFRTVTAGSLGQVLLSITVKMNVVDVLQPNPVSWAGLRGSGCLDLGRPSLSCKPANETGDNLFCELSWVRLHFWAPCSLNNG